MKCRFCDAINMIGRYCSNCGQSFHSRPAKKATVGYTPMLSCGKPVAFLDYGNLFNSCDVFNSRLGRVTWPYVRKDQAGHVDTYFVGCACVNAFSAWATIAKVEDKTHEDCAQFLVDASLQVLKNIDKLLEMKSKF
jgi:hypothetical protein